MKCTHKNLNQKNKADIAADRPFIVGDGDVAFAVVQVVIFGGIFCLFDFLHGHTHPMVVHTDIMGAGASSSPSPRLAAAL